MSCDAVAYSFKLWELSDFSLNWVEIFPTIFLLPLFLALSSQMEEKKLCLLSLACQIFLSSFHVPMQNFIKHRLHTKKNLMNTSNVWRYLRNQPMCLLCSPTKSMSLWDHICCQLSIVDTTWLVQIVTLKRISEKRKNKLKENWDSKGATLNEIILISFMLGVRVSLP